MKCSSRRNCNPEVVRTLVVDDSLNEVQLPKELQLDVDVRDQRLRPASMKCSSRRNCNTSPAAGRCLWRCLNEVQLPKELQRLATIHPAPRVMPQ